MHSIVVRLGNLKVYLMPCVQGNLDSLSNC